MKARFEWGLLADIQPPDFETRIAIIRDKAVKMGVELPDDVSNYIAENIQANIRQLEGAVKKIKAMHELMGERITVSLAENAIDALRTENPGLNPTPERIMEAVHQVLDRTPPELVADISSNGIVMTGGGSLIRGFDKLVTARTGIHTVVAENAIQCVAEGTGKSLESVGEMKDGTMNLSRRKQIN